MKLSLVTPSVGRTDELDALLAGFAEQPFRDFEWIVVDQNEDDRLAPIVARYAGLFPIRHVRSAVRNASHARNLGLALAEGEVVGFPDDDCRYRPDTMARVAGYFEARPDLSLLAGPTIGPTGRPGNGRWERNSCAINEKTVWTTVQGSSMWMRTAAAREVGGWDAAVGPGTPWGSGEEPDLGLRILRTGRRGWYDRTLCVQHPDNRLSAAARARALRYGAGMGRVMRRQNIPAAVALPFFLRPIAGAVLSLLRAKPADAGYYWKTLRGRALGYFAASREEGRMSEQGAQSLSIAVGIATSGRAETLGETLTDLARQTTAPSRVLVLYGKESDIAGLAARFPGVEFAQAAGGLCAKRNRILDDAAGADLLLFIDDDFLLDPEYLMEMDGAFRRDRALVAATGAVLADGAKGPGLQVAAARRVLSRAARGARRAARPAFNTYGCNMVFRMAAVRASGLRFDEKLPAYAWYEDIDFSRRLARHGNLMLIPGAKGVHLGVKVGRQSGRRLGYSQVANPAYLWRKGTFPLGRTLRSMGRNFTANLFRSLAPEPFVDRRGRLKGNLEAVRDLLRGRMHPERISKMP